MIIIKYDASCHIFNNKELTAILNNNRHRVSVNVMIWPADSSVTRFRNGPDRVLPAAVTPKSSRLVSRHALPSRRPYPREF